MRFRLLLANLFLTAFFFSSCEKKDKDPQPTQQSAPEPGMTATVDGKPWKALEPAVYNGNQFQIGGMSADSVSISLYHAGINQPGVYRVTAMVHKFITNTSTVYTWAHPGTEITVTKFDLTAKKASGTFSFTANANPGATGLSTIENGVFTDIPIR